MAQQLCVDPVGRRLAEVGRSAADDLRGVASSLSVQARFGSSIEPRAAASRSGRFGIGKEQPLLM